MGGDCKKTNEADQKIYIEKWSLGQMTFTALISTQSTQHTVVKRHKKREPASLGAEAAHTRAKQRHVSCTATVPLPPLPPFSGLSYQLHAPSVPGAGEFVR